MNAQDLQAPTSTGSAAVALFSNHESVEGAVKQLADNHFNITNVTVVGRGFHVEQHVAGFYNADDRIKHYGKLGAFWGGLWGLLFGGLYMTIPLFGPVFAAGHFAVMIAAAIEGSIVVGGLSAFGAALYSIGIPKDSVVRYEAAVKADGFLLMLYGTPNEIERARAILQNTQPTQLDVHENINMNIPATKQNSAVASKGLA